MKPPIIIYKRSGLYRAKLVAENGETVGTTSKGRNTFREIVSDLITVRTFEVYEIFQDKAGKHRFRTLGGLGTLYTIRLRSEPYASKQKAQQGIEACKRCLEIGLVALEFSENTDVWKLDELVNLDIKQFET